MKQFVDVLEGEGPVVLGQPHGGVFVPDNLLARMNERGQALSDTDWHIARLYQGLLDDVTVVRSNVHRYVIDANRDPTGVSLYPGKNTTSLCPTTDFDGKSIWADGQDPSADEIESRRGTYHAPYHSALTEQLARVKAKHGVAILFDCHSIRSKIPFLFEGTLPIFSIGTNSSMSCAIEVETATHQICCEHQPESTVLNERFKGGWTTRHYGQPETGQHAIQMEIAQRAYMSETPNWEYCTPTAEVLRPVLGGILKAIDHLARSNQINN